MTGKSDAPIENERVDHSKNPESQNVGGYFENAKVFLETSKVILEALIIALVVRTLLFQPFNIPSGSMIPTLLIGDFLFVSKYSYGYSQYSLPFGLPLFSGRIFGAAPKRGDVVVFKLPRDNSTDYIKRVIGLPGEKIQMREGRLYINGQMTPREPIQKFRTEDSYGREVAVATYKEILPGNVAHTIIEVDGDRGLNDNTDEFDIPPNHYFMMGDNRDNSTDSRISPSANGVGMVPFENLVGRAELIFFSVDCDSCWKVWTWKIRTERLLKTVR